MWVNYSGECGLVSNPLIARVVVLVEIELNEKLLILVLKQPNMNTANDPANNAVVDFIEDEVYYDFKRSKHEIEKVTWAIYIYTTLTLLIYVISLLVNWGRYDWMDVGITIILIAIYYCLGLYSTYKPFTAFITILCILVGSLFIEVLLSSGLSIKATVIKIAIIVFIAMRLEAAKKVQDYQAKVVK